MANKIKEVVLPGPSGIGAIPGFLLKLWTLVGDPKINHIIEWNEEGTHFTIKNQRKLSREVLPNYFKHKNLQSFVRQLNMYGFRKVAEVESGSLLNEKDEMKFEHPNFQRNDKNSLQLIKRKHQGTRNITVTVDSNALATDKVLNEVDLVKQKQNTYERKLSVLQSENTKVRKEHEEMFVQYSNLRDKYSNQQRIIEKIVRFLAGMVKPVGTQMAAKRKFNHLALEGGQNHEPSTSSSLFFQGGSNELFGPVIHEVTNADQSVCLEKVVRDDMAATGSSTLAGLGTTPNPPVSVRTKTVKAKGISKRQDLHSHSNVASSIQNYANYAPLKGNEDLSSVAGNPAINSDAEILYEQSNPTVQSPNGTVLHHNYDFPPLSPDLMNVANPSEVTPNLVVHNRFPVFTDPENPNKRHKGSKGKWMQEEETSEASTSSNLVPLRASSPFPPDLQNLSNNTELCLEYMSDHMRTIPQGGYDSSMLTMLHDVTMLHEEFGPDFSYTPGGGELAQVLVPYEEELLDGQLAAGQFQLPVKKTKLAIKSEKKEQLEDEDPLNTPRINLEAEIPSYFYQH